MIGSIAARLSALAAAGLVAGCGSPAEPRHAAATPSAGSPEFSVDAERLRGLAPIAFVGATASSTDLFVLEHDGHARNLTNDAAVEGAPAFSPDGRWIAYGSRADGDFDLMVIAARGGEPRRLTDLPTHEGNPTWSPDGKRIAFGLETADETRFAIYVVDANGGRARKLTERLGGCTNENPDWSPDGRRIAYLTGCSETDNAIMVMDTDGAHHREVASLPDANGPKWSPDGSRIAFKSDRGRAIYAVRPDGSGLRKLTPDLGTESATLDWSRDGGRIVYIDYYGSDLGVFASSGGRPRKLTRGLMASAGVSVAP